MFLQKLFLTSVTVLKAERGMTNSIGMPSKDLYETGVNLHGFLLGSSLILSVSRYVCKACFTRSRESAKKVPLRLRGFA
jgi:hypothetical protein